ncbi:hypothetical protein FT643_11795 [Ketobacter sp. MCCC 1A13808]|uniref:YncE family protein n=1 Tax=Ketobacter sp. MCCC 1A13808 TaxID=2602738 RepID=UPI0012EB41F1|nr:hypothetical protein [Ketobacter sp. MCCC 1A13808]MVF12823.1 hypothetical protein [Ketobacter sp. MCCC 1A13808]
MNPLRHGLYSLVLITAAGSAMADVIFEDDFAQGTGIFATEGRVYTGNYGIRMRGGVASGSSVTSSAISTQGYENLVLQFRREASGLDSGETGTASVSINGGAFTPLESITDGNAATMDFPLPDTASGKNIRVRFALQASSFFETYTIASLTLNGDGGDEPPAECPGGPECPVEPECPGDPSCPVDPPQCPGDPDCPPPTSEFEFPSAPTGKPAAGDFVTFESGHVRPMALSGDGNTLYAVNTPDNKVEVYDVSGTTPQLVERIRVGMEPVAVALLNDSQLWVSNHLSDSVSIVDVSVSPAVIKQTLLVGDEPRDIVFGGANDQFAFITVAHRGQNVPFDPKMQTAGVGRADVWVFDTGNTGNTLTGEPRTILNMFGDTTRALARSPDGETIYAAVFNSGNRTTVLTDDRENGDILDKAPPFENVEGAQQPETGLIVQYNGRNWVDNGDPTSGVAPKIWDQRVKLSLPDYDVFEIDASGGTPRVVNRISGVGTTLFNMAVNPSNGQVYVSNQEARNVVRFEGPGNNSTTVNGHFVESRITVINNGNPNPRHLNKHINYNSRPGTGTAAERNAALATPLEMAVSNNGANLYLAAMGSDKLARFSTSQLASDNFTPSADDHVKLSGGGPTGVVLDEARNRAFVTTRFDNGISIVSTGGRMSESAHVTMNNPEPAVVKNGRRFLYDATYTSSRGDSSCAGCHIFGNMDHLAWDLGNPDEDVAEVVNTYNRNTPSFLGNDEFHPMKGPMTTQSFRGMKGNGPMHWRGDRQAQTRSAGETLEEQSFEDFIVAFPGLLGRATPLTDQEMDAFAKYALELTYPPNPVMNLDNSLTAQLEQAYDVYNNKRTDGTITCNGCHRIDPVNGNFGTDGTMTIEGAGVEEDMKIPHLRNVYERVGMFGYNSLFRGPGQIGDQIRGFGYDNMGSAGTVSIFLDSPTFNLTAAELVQVEALAIAAPSDMNPIVGQQVTVTKANRTRSDVRNRINLLVERALVTSPRAECDLVATTVVDGQSVGWVMNARQGFVPSDTGLTSATTLDGVLDYATGKDSTATFTCVPPGSGTRMGG